MQKELLIVFSKPPILGKVKTRLAAEVGEEVALILHSELFEKTIKTVKQAAVSYTIYLTEKDPTGTIRDYKIQLGDDLGARMMDAIRNELFRNHKVCLIGSDCIDLCADDIKEAFRSLDANDMVLGPAKDGGYYLIGMKNNIPDLFANIEWSTAYVYEQTVAKAKGLGLSHYQLKTRTDIDLLKDLPTDWKINNFKS